MFEYIICNQFDNEIFNEQCKVLEKNIPNLIIGKLSIDVDESMIQEYIQLGKKINVYNDHYKGGVYILSAINLTTYFTNT